MFIPVPIDLETTGLEASEHVILEFSMLLVTPDLEFIADFGSRVIHASEEQLARMTGFVSDMHAGTGLLDAVRASKLSIDEVDAEAAAWLAAHGLTNHPSGILLGSSCRLDLNFIERHMPQLAEVLHYRMIDISGIEEALQLWAPELIPGEPFEVALTEGWTAHRAASDIRWSLAKARGLRAVFAKGWSPIQPQNIPTTGAKEEQ